MGNGVDEPIALDDAIPAGSVDRGTIILALLGIAVPIACGIIAGNFGVVFTDLGIRIPAMTAWFLHPRAHALAGIVLVGLSLASRTAIGSAAYAVVAMTYVATLVFALFAPLMVIVERLGPA